MKPLVSIICITYNQEKFIAQALDGFLMQKTNFQFEIIIHDDASTDKTPAIIKKYAKQHPDIFKVIYEKENQYSKKSWKFLNDMFYMAKGKYITTCEGDDFWTDESKLQKQVDFLEAKPDYTVCFHAVRVFFEDGTEGDDVSPNKQETVTFNLENLLRNNYIHTCSVMYRKQAYENLAEKIMPYDIYMHVYHARLGKIGFIKDVMGAYRRQNAGVWWNSRSNMSEIYQQHRYMIVNLFSEILEMLKDEGLYKSIIDNHLKFLFESFIEIDKAHNTKLFTDTAKDFPKLVADFSMNQKLFIDELKTENKRLNTVNKTASDELTQIKQSHWYRMNPKNLLN